MGRRLLVMAPILACVTLAGCSGGATSSAPGGPAGSPDNPQVFSCGEESFLVGSMPQMPEPGDLALGPLIIISGKAVATGDPSGWGEHGSYKIPFFVTGRSTVTVTIDAPARARRDRQPLCAARRDRRHVPALLERAGVLRPGFQLHRWPDPGLRSA